MVSALTVSESTKTRGREHAGWAGSLGNVATTHRWNGGQQGTFINTLLSIYFALVWKPVHPNVHTGGDGRKEGVSSGCRLNSHSYWIRVGMGGSDKRYGALLRTELLRVREEGGRALAALYGLALLTRTKSMNGERL